jgi:uncharacterized protein
LNRLSGPVGRQVRRKRRDLVAAAAAHGVTNLRVFGSVARGEDRPGSDVDLLVDLPPDIGLLRLGRVQAELEDIVGTKVDLVPATDLKPAVRARAERDLVALSTLSGTAATGRHSGGPSTLSAPICSEVT